MTGWLAVAFAVCPFALQAQITGYLKIPEIQGESQRVDHEEEIDIHSFEWVIEQANATLAGSGRTRARAEAGPLLLRKFTDASSPYLALAVLQGKSFDEMVFAVRKDSGEAHLDYLIITMTNVTIVSYKVLTKDGATQPEEQVGLLFEEVKIKYTVQADDHSAGDEHEIEYDIAAGV